MSEPLIIQGGMGIAVSNWRLAKTVSEAGQLGVVSGTALHLVFAERLKRGDPGGHLRRALSAFPFPSIAEEVWRSYFADAGESPLVKPVPMFHLNSNEELLKLVVISNFCEVFLAKEGHPGKIGINYLEKVQFPHLASLYGAMLAGVDYVLMGAGIPREIPAVLDQLATHQDVSIKLHVDGASSNDEYAIQFSPTDLFKASMPALIRPKFIAIISSDTLALTLAKKSSGKVDGFVVELPVAGGHNAPPRGKGTITEKGEVIYGKKDIVSLDKIKSLGLPFWMAGGYGHPHKLAEALEAGASGIQAGTAFAFSQESGLSRSLRQAILQKVLDNNIQVTTDPLASPTGFPFKVVQLEDTLSESEVYEKRNRVCQIGLLRRPYKRHDGSLGYRCPGEPVNDYVSKGGKLEDTVEKKCLCNALMANIGLNQTNEPPLITAGNALKQLRIFLQPGQLDYSSNEVITYILSQSKHATT